MILTSFRGLLGLTPRRIPAGRGAVPRCRFRPNADRLEDRSLLTGFTATTATELVADIKTANQVGGANTITLVSGTAFLLTAVDNTTDGATGLPIIAANDILTILGNGDTIARSTAPGTPAFRLFDVAAGASLTLQNLTLQGGLASGGGVSAEGGAIYSQGTVDLAGAIVQNNTAQGVPSPSSFYGEAASGGGIYSGGALTLEGGSRVQNNQALGVAGAPGGGTRFDFSSGGRGGEGMGGGVYLAGGTFTLSGGSLSANSAQGGNGGRGGGYGPNGGNGGNGAGGGLYVANGSVSLTGASLLTNISRGGRGGDGKVGGVRQGRGGDGGNGAGGGVYVKAGTLTLRYDTVMTNSALGGSGGSDSSGGGVGSPGLGIGGGLFIEPAAVVCLDASTQAHVRKNRASTSDRNIYGPWTPC